MKANKMGTIVTLVENPMFRRHASSHRGTLVKPQRWIRADAQASLLVPTRCF